MSRRDRGQAAVEFALVLPLVVLVLLGMLQIVVVLVDQVRLVHVVRDAARAAAVSGEPDTAARIATASSGLSGVRVTVDSSAGSLLVVTGELDVDTGVPVIGRLIPTLTLRDRLYVHAEPSE